MLAGWATMLALVVISLPTGRAVTRLAGERSWTGLEPATGLALVVALAAVVARITADSATLILALAVLLLAAGLVLRHPESRGRPPVETGLVLVLAICFAALNLPFIVSGDWGLTGGRPAGPLGADSATGLLMAAVLTVAWTAWTATGRLDGWKRPLAATTASLPYMLCAFYVRGTFRELAAAAFLLAFVTAVDPAVTARQGDGRPARRLVVPVVLTAGAVLVWVFGGDLQAVPGEGPAPASPIEGLGVWLNPDYGPAPDNETPLPGLLAATGLIALLVSSWWWLRDRDRVWPAALAGCVTVGLVALAWPGGQSPAQVMAVTGPVILTFILVALLSGPAGGWKPQQGMEFGGWVSLAALFVIVAIASSVIALTGASPDRTASPDRGLPVRVDSLPGETARD